MAYRPELPLVVQSDRSLLLEVGGPLYDACRDALAPFCELLKSPEHVHTYRITPISVWNAASAGLPVAEMIATLERFSRFDLPKNVLRDVADLHARYGRLKLDRVPVSEPALEGLPVQEGASVGGMLRLSADDPLLIEEVANSPLVKHLVTRAPDGTLRAPEALRGELKQALVKQGLPAEDLAGYVEGAPLQVELRETTLSGKPFVLRDYQHESVRAFDRDGAATGGSGVVVLPCGAGKTVVGIGAMARLGRRTLVLTTNQTAVLQWRRELLDKTRLTDDQIGEYTGRSKDVRPVTIATYQILTHRKRKTDPFTHFELFQSGDWGLVIYDEVHLLPAPVFRVTARIQAVRRLGLTATLLREDGREDDVFSLIGPKRYDVPWRVLERRGFIAEAACTEVRLPLPRSLRERYVAADRRGKFRIAAENPAKASALDALLRRHKGERVLVIAQYLDQLHRVSRHVDAPLITGETPGEERRTLYDAFRDGKITVLVVSKVGNFAVDLPEAAVLVQLSGTFGSRQEEAQRLGRVLRPKEDGRGARFYTLVSHGTTEEGFAQHRQLFLTEQGYAYDIVGPEGIGLPMEDAEAATDDEVAAPPVPANGAPVPSSGAPASNGMSHGHGTNGVVTTNGAAKTNGVAKTNGAAPSGRAPARKPKATGEDR
jgi:DNA excision repair protein ERCC-3